MGSSTLRPTKADDFLPDVDWAYVGIMKICYPSAADKGVQVLIVPLSSSAKGSANENNCYTEEKKKKKLAKSCFAGWSPCKICPKSVRLWVSFIIRVINKRAHRQMAQLLIARAVLSETMVKWIPVCKQECSPNMSGSAKLACRHKFEVTLIDYLELICIFRVIMSVGNRTNRHNHWCGALMMFLIMLSSPPAAGKISKGLSSQNWTINEQTWSRGDIWKWAGCRPLPEPAVLCL